MAMEQITPRAQRYLARLDALLTQTTDDWDVETILLQQLKRWETLYRQFRREARKGQISPHGPQATDYTETIDGITKRLAHLHSPGCASE
jgi:hypothetical protein